MGQVMEYKEVTVPKCPNPYILVLEIVSLVISVFQEVLLACPVDYKEFLFTQMY